MNQTLLIINTNTKIAKIDSNHFLPANSANASAMKKISEYGPQIIVVKRGALGQIVYDVLQDKKYEVPAYASRMEDPTGAGDTFCGGFLAGYQKTNDPLKAALYGSVSASLKIEGSGAFHTLEVMPGLAEARLHALEQMAREI